MKRKDARRCLVWLGWMTVLVALVLPLTITVGQRIGDDALMGQRASERARGQILRQHSPSPHPFFSPPFRLAPSRSFRSRQQSQNVELIGATGGVMNAVFIKDNIAYCAGALGLSIFDVSNPRQPRIMSNVTLPSPAYGVYVSGSYAYVADDWAGLRIIDVSNPSSPVEISFYDTPGYAQSVYVLGSYAYVADGEAGLRIIDVSNPSSPREVSFYDTPSAAEGVYVLGSYAYVADAYRGLRIIDVSNPSSPVEVGFYDTPGYAQSVYVLGSYAYVADVWAGLRIIDVSNPSSPREVSYYSTVWAVGVYVSGFYAYVADGKAGLRIIDVSNPSSPVEISFYDTLGSAVGVYVSGQYAYVADGSAGLLIIDVSNPSSPREVGFYDTPVQAFGVYVSGQYAYVAAEYEGLRVIDVSNPSSPVEVGFYDTPGSAYSVYVSGSYAYVADGGAGLRIIDVSNPSSPVEVGFYDTPGSAVGVYVSGQYAYVADGGAGLRIIDVSNPSSPVEVGFYDTPGSAVGVYVSGQYAYVADGGAGLRIIDVSNPSSPVEVGFYDTPGKARSVYVSGQYAYVADEESGLWIIDVSNPFSPGGVGHYDTPGYAWSVYVQGQYAYVADWMAGLRIIDVSNPASPTEVGFFNTPEYAYAWGVYISGQYAYVAAGEAGLLILRFTGAVINQPPSVPVLISPSEGEIVSPTPTFRLKAEDPDGDQVRFEIQVVKGDETRTFTTGFVASGAEATFVVLSNQALSEGQWRWKAKAIDTSGAESGWSEERTFTVQAPPVTWTLLEPFGPVAQVPIFRFKAELNPPPTERLQYRVEISRDPQFSEQVIVFDQSVDPTGWSQSDYAPEEIAVFIAHYAFPLNAQLYWRARVKKVGENAYSDPSPAQLFRVIQGFNITPPDRIRVGRIERIPITIYNPSPVPQEFIISHEVSTNDPNFGGRARLIDPRGTVLDEVTISPNEVALLQYITPPLEQGRHIFFVEVEVRENQRVENTTRIVPVLGFVGSVVVGVAFSFVAEKLCEEAAKAVLKRDYGFTDEEANTVMDVIKEAGEEATEKELGERAVSNMVKEELERRGKRELAGKLFRKVGTKGIPYVWVVFTIADCAEGLSKATKATKSPPAAPPIVRSWDPNMKVGILGREGFIQAEETLAYRILFENIPPPPPALPAPAQEVIITDILDENIDLSTLTFTSVGFGNHTITFPDETRTISVDVDLGEVEGKRLVVQIRGQLDVNTRTLEVSFRGIDPETGQLHPVGFLPVNDNPPEGEGWVAFEVRLKEDVQSGTQIKNKASIKFDVNPPMETNEVVVTVDRIVPESHVTEITNDGISFEANDDVSGIDVVELWVSEERVNFRGTRQVIIGDRKYSLHSTLSGSATPKFSFRGKFGYNYRFYTVARDVAGNKEPEPDDSDARVTIGQPPTLPAGLHMVSVPVESEDADPKEVFLFEGNKWARWDPEARGGQGGYVFYDNDPTGFTRFSEPEKVPGRGYWVYIPQQTIVQVYGNLPDETKPFVIPLKRGWNQIGNPWLSDLVWDINEIKVQVGNETKPMKDARGIVELYAWRWDGSNYQLIFDQNILPNVDNRIPAWEGAWVYAWQDCNLIVPPPQGNRSRQGRMAREKPEGWFAKLVAQIGDGKGEGFFGISPKTRLQISQPPSPPERQGEGKVQVLFLNKEGNQSIADIRAGIGQRQEWDVVVKFGTRDGGRGTRKEEVTLTWDGIGYAPKDVSLTLIDLTTGMRRYMRTQTAYSFVPDEGETERRFKVIAEIGNERPLRIVGLKATPMRGQGVVIEFALTKPAQVQAEVLTLTGRRIALLGGQGSKQAGLHRFIWRGVNGDGAKVSAGVYLVRVQAIDEEGRQVQSVTTVRIRP